MYNNLSKLYPLGTLKGQILPIKGAIKGGESSQILIIIRVTAIIRVTPTSP